MAESPLREELGRLVARFGEQNLPIPIVDLGGTASSRKWLAGVLGRIDFETWDSLPGKKISKVVDACQMPQIKKDSLGTIISTSVLEHVWQPFFFASEVARVLRPGGLILVTTVFAYRYHPAPEDYWRFSPVGLRMLFSSNFYEEECDWMPDPGDGTMGVYFCGIRK